VKLENLKNLYIHELKDLHSAEKQLTKALLKMAKAAGNEELASAFREGMEGLIKEGAEMIEEDAENEVRDAGLISTAQRVEHYEIAGYGCARTYAELLGDKEGAEILEQTLNEEKETDEKLTDLARSINVEGEGVAA